MTTNIQQGDVSTRNERREAPLFAERNSGVQPAARAFEDGAHASEAADRLKAWSAVVAANLI